MPVILVEFLDIFSKSTQISNCMKIPPVGAELFYADRRMDGQTDMTNLIVAFRNFTEAPENPNKSCTDADLLTGTSAILVMTSWLYSFPVAHKCPLVRQITTDSIHML